MFIDLLYVGRVYLFILFYEVGCEKIWEFVDVVNDLNLVYCDVVVVQVFGYFDVIVLLMFLIVFMFKVGY